MSGSVMACGDRVSFTAEPIQGFYVTPMMDFNVEGPSSLRMPEGGQPFDLSQADDAHSYILAVQRRDTEQERLAKLDSGGHSANPARASTRERVR